MFVLESGGSQHFDLHKLLEPGLGFALAKAGRSFDGLLLLARLQDEDLLSPQGVGRLCGAKVLASNAEQSWRRRLR